MGPAVQRKELRNLMKKNQILKKQLDSLERDYLVWNEKREMNDLENIITTIIAVSQMVIDAETNRLGELLVL